MNVGNRITDDFILKVFIAGFMIFTALTVIFPLWFVITASFSDPDAVFRGENILWFQDFQVEGYKRIFSQNTIFLGYMNSIIYSVFGAGAGITMVVPFAFAISRRRFFAKKLLTIMLLITMYFSGGLIPLFIVVQRIGLYNTRLIIIILGSLNAWYVFIARTFFMTTIPEELWEALVIDGGDHFQFFFRVVLPLSGAIIAVLVLFQGVNQWNDFFRGLIFLSSYNKWPLQLHLKDILTRIESSEMSMLMDVESMDDRMRIAGIVKYGLIVASTLPVLIVYPFMQKYFVRGVMLGSIKG